MYQTLKLKKGRDKAIINRHPWVFSGAVQQIPELTNGEIVQVCTFGGDPIGYGFYSSESQISCRLFEHAPEPQDFESSVYWQSKINKAFSLRKELVIKSDTKVYRLIHAEGDFMPGLIVDIYDNIAVVQVLIMGVARILPTLVNCLQEIGFQNIYLKSIQQGQNIENTKLKSEWLSGQGELLTEAVENDIMFKIDIEKGQKTGFFIDQRENRMLLKKLAYSKKILNVFSYSGGFSLYALSGGASEVHSVDISKEANQLCEDNIALNFGKQAIKHKSITADCFDYLRNNTEEYDVIVLDPPAFAKSARVVPHAARGYKEINLQAFKQIKKGGFLFTFSCSHHIDKELFRKIVFGAAADSGREIKVIHQLTQPADHPINIYHPEGEYLKGLVLRVD